LEKMKKINFDEEKMEVTVDAGVSWDELMNAISLPKYCTKVFPNNPGQKIHVTGNASVGGAGFYSSKHGGLWNTVKRLTLVTMTGEIIECSLDKNKDYFTYALGGFGRIGVIADITLEVVKSKSHVLSVLVFYITA